MHFNARWSSFGLYLQCKRWSAIIEGNKKAKRPSKIGQEKGHYDAISPHEFAHSTPYFYQKDWWHSMIETLDKGHIRFLEKHIIKFDDENTLEVIATLFSNIDKWINNKI